MFFYLCFPAEVFKEGRIESEGGRSAWLLLLPELSLLHRARHPGSYHSFLSTHVSLNKQQPQSLTLMILLRTIPPTFCLIADTWGKPVSAAGKHKACLRLPAVLCPGLSPCLEGDVIKMEMPWKKISSDGQVVSPDPSAPVSQPQTDLDAAAVPCHRRPSFLSSQMWQECRPSVRPSLSPSLRGAEWSRRGFQLPCLSSSPCSIKTFPSPGHNFLLLQCRALGTAEWPRLAEPGTLNNHFRTPGNAGGGSAFQWPFFAEAPARPAFPGIRAALFSEKYVFNSYRDRSLMDGP
ncbi:uncharacterized protein LOC104865320 [Fukomys damarensis]|uniref:uncharacterized protein LOC104865320 n=1 Tax=Fukomys damarensis TaxID=885580 RepID=UPI0014559C1D|nr:uncharacterized protein LOC104865320 [Fukomys damarensis]